MIYNFARVVNKDGLVVGLLQGIQVNQDDTYRFGNITIDGTYARENPEETKNLRIHIPKEEIVLPFNLSEHPSTVSPHGAIMLKGDLYGRLAD